MYKKIVIFILCIVLAAAVLVGCNESYKQSAVATPDLSNEQVVSNGGLAVRIGKYLYYVNGYAGNTVDNAFGDVLKGAIVRVELADDGAGAPKDETNTVIVPKNVYNTVATSGLYIVGDYIYYSSPSTEKNSSGVAKSAEMHLLRTKLDGSATDLIAKFSDYTAVYKVVDGYVLYVLNNELHQIDLKSKKFTDTLVDEEISGFHMTDYKASGNNAFINAVFYIKASEDKTASHSVMWCYRAGGEPAVVIEGSAASYKPPYILEDPRGYTLAVTESHYVGDNLRLIYTKTDSGSYTSSNGTYAYDFTSALTFDAANEVRYSSGETISGFYFLADGETALVTSGTALRLIKKENGAYQKIQELVPNSPSVFHIDETAAGDVTLYYIISNVLYRTPLLKKEAGAYVFKSEYLKVENLFSASYNATWLSLDKVGNYLYFWNSSVSDYTYYVDMTKLVTRDADSQKPVLLSLITNEDQITLLG